MATRAQRRRKANQRWWHNMLARERVTMTWQDEACYMYAMVCPLCGMDVIGHDNEACDRKMAAWRPVGILGNPNGVGVST